MNLVAQSNNESDDKILAHILITLQLLWGTADHVPTQNTLVTGTSYVVTSNFYVMAAWLIN